MRAAEGTISNTQSNRISNWCVTDKVILCLTELRINPYILQIQFDQQLKSCFFLRQHLPVSKIFSLILSKTVFVRKQFMCVFLSNGVNTSFFP